MNRKSRNTWSAILSFALAFSLGVSPHAAHADTTDDKQVVEQPAVSNPVDKQTDEQPAASNPDDKQADDQPASSNPDEQGIVPLVLAPVAAYGMTSTVVSSIFTAGLGWYVGSSDLFKSTVNDKQNTSSAQYGIQYTPYSYTYYPDFAGFAIETSATKHMEETLVKATADRIKNYGRFGNLRVYSSTRKPSNVMAVIDITSSMGGTVNRHLGNYLSGKIGPYSNTAYKNEWMDLAGYSLFLVTDKSTGQFFHAHFTPTRLVDAETEYQRYVGEYDVQLFPSITKDTKYQRVDYYYTKNRNAAMDNRGLIHDPNDRFPSLIPYK